MKTSHIVLLVIALFTTPFVIVGGSYMSAYNNGVEWVGNINKFDKESQNTLANYTTKIGEMIQIPALYKNDLKEIVSATFGGRYGKDGSQAVMQMIQEQNLPFDSSMYVKIQNTIESGRNEFRLSQTKKIDICEEYNKQVSYLWSGTFMKLAGYTKATVEKQCVLVLNDHTNNAFKTGIDNGIKF